MKTKVLIFNKSGKKLQKQFYYNNILLDNVTRYKYLGVIFQASGSFSEAQRELYNKGQKAFFKLRRAFGANCPSVSTLFHIFDHTIVPILLYGCEIWGTFNPSLNRIKKETDFKIHQAYVSIISENLHLKFCKYALGVNSRATNNAVYGEVGRYPLYTVIVKSMFSYWRRLESQKKSNLLSEALSLSKSLNDKGKLSWFSSVKFISDDLGLNIENAENVSVSEISYSIRELFERKWKRSMWDDSSSKNGKNKLRTYREFKNRFSMENYLLSITNRSLRIILCKFRISCHDLAIERGRYKNLKVEERVCSCNGTSVEDEFHFLMECPLYNSLRQSFFNWITTVNKNYCKLPSKAKFIWLLSNENSDICQNLSKFILQAKEKRDLL